MVSPKNKKIYSLNIVKSKLSEISSYIDCTLKVFFESQHPRMLRVLDYYALEKSYLVIVAEYNNQYSLKEYRGLIDRFPP